MNKEETLSLYTNIDKIGKKKKLLLHVCCAPCTSGVLDQIKKYFDITLFYYNPNTYPKDEYDKRYDQFSLFENDNQFPIIKCNYDESEFLSVSKGLEDEPEGGKRCHECYKLRLEATAKAAKENSFDAFTSTLSVSPYKNADLLNKYGQMYEDKYNISYIYSDFKKNDGYKNSIKNSKDLGMYRQDYCGCRYSLNERRKH